ncbi:MAG: LptF/LptG family permease [Candidatus Omnitrophica bacterium]|nr:LptF/LptG family permease [Candidatus Omnitrophota bacterium]
MKILHRYLLKEIIPPFLFGIGIFTFIFFLEKLFDLSDFIITKHVGIWPAIQIFLLCLPSTLPMTLPIATFIGVLIGLTRLKGDYELTAIFAGGIRFTSFFWLLIGVGLLMSLLTVGINESLIPWANQRFWQVYSDALKSSSFIPIKSGNFIKVKDMDIYICKIQGMRLEGIYFYQKEQAVFARKGEMIKKPSRIIFNLQDGTIHKIDKKDASRYHLLQFDTHTIVADFGESNAISIKKRIQDMTTLDLRQEILRYRQSSMDILPLLIELYKKIALPFACISLVLVGIPLGMSLRQKGKSMSLSLSIVFVFAYYLLLMLSQILCEKRVFYPGFGMWLPNIIIAVTGICLYVRRRL